MVLRRGHAPHAGGCADAAPHQVWSNRPRRKTRLGCRQPDAGPVLGGLVLGIVLQVRAASGFVPGAIRGPVERHRLCFACLSSGLMAVERQRLVL